MAFGLPEGPGPGVRWNRPLKVCPRETIRGRVRRRTVKSCLVPAPPTAARVVVGVSGSLGSLTALCRAAVEARRRSAALWPVLAWEPPGGDLAARRSSSSYVLLDDWRRMACRNLLTALDDAFRPRRPGERPCRARHPGPGAGGDRRRRGRHPCRRRRPAKLLPPRLLPLGEPLLPRPRRLPGSRGAAVPAGGGVDQCASPQHLATAPGRTTLGRRLRTARGLNPGRRGLDSGRALPV